MGERSLQPLVANRDNRGTGAARAHVRGGRSANNMTEPGAVSAAQVVHSNASAPVQAQVVLLSHQRHPSADQLAACHRFTAAATSVLQLQCTTRNIRSPTSQHKPLRHQPADVSTRQSSHRSHSLQLLKTVHAALSPFHPLPAALGDPRPPCSRDPVHVLPTAFPRPNPPVPSTIQRSQLAVPNKQPHGSPL